MEQDNEVIAGEAASGPPLDLECFALTPYAPRLVACTPERDWMDAFPSRHAYRCLPLNIANAHGWQLLSPCAFQIKWNGGMGADDISLRALDGYEHFKNFAVSNFTRGIVTFHTNYLFRTSPGWQLLATGPFNAPKHRLTPLTGIIESDWLPYPFTMNWQLTNSGIVRFEKDEPFCQIFPIPQRALNDVTPTIRDIESEPELKRQYEAWKNKRTDFVGMLKADDPATIKQAWQKYYFRGELAEAGIKAPAHEHKLRLNEPSDARAPVTPRKPS